MTVMAAENSELPAAPAPVFVAVAVTFEPLVRLTGKSTLMLALGYWRSCIFGCPVMPPAPPFLCDPPAYTFALAIPSNL